MSWITAQGLRKPRLLNPLFRVGNKMSSSFLMFVYGTLKQGQPNHHVLQKEENGTCKFLGTGTTTKQYPLVIASKYNIPYLLHAEGKGKTIYGEIYEIDGKMCQTLDDFERHPTYYERDTVSIMMTKDLEDKEINPGKVTECCCYFMKSYKPHLSDLPHLDNYDSEGSHGLKYASRYAREIANYSAQEDVCTSNQ